MVMVMALLRFGGTSSSVFGVRPGVPVFVTEDSDENRQVMRDVLILNMVSLSRVKWRVVCV
jgi:E3 ubiquitin-protein ligase DOA10